MWRKRDEFAACLPTDAQDAKYPAPPTYTAVGVQPVATVMQSDLTVVQPTTVIQTQPAVMVVNPVGESCHVNPFSQYAGVPFRHWNGKQLVYSVFVNCKQMHGVCCGISQDRVGFRASDSHPSITLIQTQRTARSPATVKNHSI